MVSDTSPPPSDISPSDVFRLRSWYAVGAGLAVLPLLSPGTQCGVDDPCHSIPHKGSRDGRAIAHTNSKSNAEKALGQMISTLFQNTTVNQVLEIIAGPKAIGSETLNFEATSMPKATTPPTTKEPHTWMNTKVGAHQPR